TVKCCKRSFEVSALQHRRQLKLQWNSVLVFVDILKLPDLFWIPVLKHLEKGRGIFSAAIHGFLKGLRIKGISNVTPLFWRDSDGLVRRQVTARNESGVEIDWTVATLPTRSLLNDSTIRTYVNLPVLNDSTIRLCGSPVAFHVTRVNGPIR